MLVGELPVPKNIYSYKENGVAFYFEAIPLSERDLEGKNISKKISRAVELLSLYHNGKVRKKEKLSKDGVDYVYIEVVLESGKKIRNVLFAERSKLVHLYAIGEVADVFGMDANYFLRSWKLGEKAPIVNQDETQEVISVEEIYNSPETTFPDTWKRISIDKNIVAAFPATPFRRTTVVEFGTRDITIDAWSRHSDSYNLNFVITKRVYGSDEGQLSDDELYEYIIQQIVDIKGLKRIDRGSMKRPGLDCSEYVLAKGLKFYKIQLFRIDQTIYQVLVKGGRKNINKAEADRFLGGIKRVN